MFTCDCGKEVERLSGTLDSRTGETKYVCKYCDPSSNLEKITAPSDMKLWMGWEVDPAHYKKTDDGYQASDSINQDLHDWAMRRDRDEERRIAEAIEKRRQYAKSKRNETEEERKMNDEKARELVRKWEQEARLQSLGIEIVEGI